MPEITAEDIDDLGGVEPFALEPSKIAKYNIRFVGKEKIDELNLYILTLLQKVMPDPKKPKDRFSQVECGSMIRIFRSSKQKARCA